MFDTLFLKPHPEVDIQTQTTETQIYGSSFVITVCFTSLKFTFQRCSEKGRKVTVFARETAMKALTSTKNFSTRYSI
jgi:hypothetical protein